MMLAYNPIAFYLGNIPVAWYALFILTGVIIALIMGVREAKRIGLDPNDIYDGLLYILPLAIIGARLYFVLFDSFSNGGYYNWNILKILGFTYNGTKINGFKLEGLAIHGGILFAIIGIIVYYKVKKLNIWKIVDVVAPGFLIGQICGRWGNFMNQEVYGGKVDNLNFLPSFISNQMFIEGSYRQPLFLYEGLWNLVMLVAFLIIRRKKLLKIGDLLPIYFIWYGIGRAWLEPLRDQSFILTNSGGAYQSVITSILLVGAGIGLLVYKYLKLKELPLYWDVLKENEETYKRSRFDKWVIKIKEKIKKKKNQKSEEVESEKENDNDSTL